MFVPSYSAQSADTRVKIEPALPRGSITGEPAVFSSAMLRLSLLVLLSILGRTSQGQWQWQAGRGERWSETRAVPAHDLVPQTARSLPSGVPNDTKASKQSVFLYFQPPPEENRGMAPRWRDGLVVGLLAILMVGSVATALPSLLGLENHVGVLPYTRHEAMVTMRDGVKLNTISFVPLSLKKKTFDAVLIRTPYGTSGLKGTGEYYIDQGFAAVMQDFRGRYDSKGSFECWFNASTDAADTLAWLQGQPWSTGAAFAQGMSANGIAAYFMEVADLNSRLLRAQFVAAGTADLHATFFQGGAYRYSLVHGWLSGISELSFEQNFTSHEGQGAYWNNVTLTDKWDRVTAPAVHLSGWYDIFNEQQIDAFYGYQDHSSAGQGLNFLVIPPTGHCAGGQVAWPNVSAGIDFATTLAIDLFKALGSDPERAAVASARLAATPSITWYVLLQFRSELMHTVWFEHCMYIVRHCMDMLLYMCFVCSLSDSLVHNCKPALRVPAA